MTRTQKRLAIAGIALLAGSWWITTVEAAAPWFIMFYGEGLSKPVILDNWEENMRFMIAANREAKVTTKLLEERPYLKVAMFWGPEWARYKEEGKPVSKLRAEQANQHGCFYPAFGNERPIFIFDSVPGPGAWTREVNEEGAKILARHGIPITVSKEASVRSREGCPEIQRR